MVYLSGAVRPEYHAAGLSFMLNPQMGNALPEGATFALDNGVFGTWRRAQPHDIDGWLRRLDRHPRQGCLFAVAPDIISTETNGCWESFERSYSYLERIRSMGLPAALVAQNAFNHIVTDADDDRLWDEHGGFSDSFDVLFIGGTLVCPAACDLRALPVGSRACDICGAPAVEWKE